MRDFAIVFVHLIVTLARLARPGGLRSVVAESVLVRVAVGISVARYPPHRSPRAALPHEMCSSTFHAICGRETYVASSQQLRWNERTDCPGRHITTLVYRPLKNVISAGFSRQCRFELPALVTSHFASALAFISRSISA